MAHNVLIVEDEALIAFDLQQMVEDCGHEVCGCASRARDALALAEDNHPSVALVDINLAGERDGVEVAQELAEKGIQALIFCTSQTDPATMSRMEACEPVAVLSKPVTQDALERSLSHC